MQRQGKDFLAEVATQLQRFVDVVPHANGAVQASRGHNGLPLTHVQTGDGLVVKGVRQQPQLARLFALEVEGWMGDNEKKACTIK